MRFSEVGESGFARQRGRALSGLSSGSVGERNPVIKLGVWFLCSVCKWVKRWLVSTRLVSSTI